MLAFEKPPAEKQVFSEYRIMLTQRVRAMKAAQVLAVDSILALGESEINVALDNFYADGHSLPPQNKRLVNLALCCHAMHKKQWKVATGILRCWATASDDPKWSSKTPANSACRFGADEYETTPEQYHSACMRCLLTPALTKLVASGDMQGVGEFFKTFLSAVDAEAERAMRNLDEQATKATTEQLAIARCFLGVLHLEPLCANCSCGDVDLVWPTEAMAIKDQPG